MHAWRPEDNLWAYTLYTCVHANSLDSYKYTLLAAREDQINSTKILIGPQRRLSKGAHRQA